MNKHRLRPNGDSGESANTVGCGPTISEGSTRLSPNSSKLKKIKTSILKERKLNLMNTIEIVGYTALHAAGDHRWRCSCILCYEMGEFSQEKLYEHLNGRHGLDRKDLKLEKGDYIFLCPKKNELEKNATTN